MFTLPHTPTAYTSLVSTVYVSSNARKISAIKDLETIYLFQLFAGVSNSLYIFMIKDLYLLKFITRNLLRYV